jgi:N-carbamoyl-L-amino-acid hydrolase
VEVVEEAAKDCKVSYRKMVSGAAHDAQIMARVSPVAMIFVPSKGGLSHSPQEWTDYDDIEAGAGVMLRVIERFAFEGEGKDQ